MKMKFILSRLSFILLTALLLFLTFNRHSKSGYFNYHSELWADKAGYYVYLPAALKYDFNPEKFPEDIDKKTGDGFFLGETVRTRYTYGVALLQLPFYLAADAFAETAGFEADGFSPIYHWAINVAAVFYLMFGFLLLFQYLRKELPPGVVYLMLASVFLGTNLYFYAIDETGMSHVYSFFLFAAFLYLLQRTEFLARSNLKFLILLGIVAGITVLIRPTNIIFLISFFYLRTHTMGEITQRLKRLLIPKNLFVLGLSALLIFIPQFIYWKYTHGNFITYSYGEAGFNWLEPMILHTWFSPNNGLFLYTPFFIIITAGLVYGIYTRKIQSVCLGITFLLISYVFAAWFDWGFGCSFGARSYVEYLALFCIPTGHLIYSVRRSARWLQLLFWFLVLTCIAYNLKMTYSYDECFTGERIWDWKSYYELLISPTR